MNNKTQIKVVGIDLAKNVFQIHGRDARGKVVMEKSVKRLKLKDNITALGNCMIAMESCSSSNYWAQEFRRMYNGPGNLNRKNGVDKWAQRLLNKGRKGVHYGTRKKKEV